jgi:PAS domain S-box-containing protein
MIEKILRRFIEPKYSGTQEKASVLKKRVTELTSKIEQQMVDYDALLNGIDTMVWLTYQPELQGKANEAFLKFFNVKQSDIEGKPLIELLPPEEAVECIKINQTVFETGKPITTYEWVPRHDGAKRLLKINKRLKKNGTTYIVASAEDITDLEKVRGQLEKEGQFTNSLVDTAHALILVLDIHGNILRCNKYFETVTGYEFSEIKGLNWFDTFIKESDQNQLEGIFQSCLENKPDCEKSVINPIKTKDGKELLIEWFSQTLMDNYNVAIGVISVGQNVTDQKLAEEELWAKIIELEIKLKKVQDLNKNTGAGKVVLLVEDEQNVLQLISVILQRQGYTVIQSSNTDHAREILDSGLKIDLLITDFYMEGINGYQLVQYAQEKDDMIKYLVISGLYPTAVEIPPTNFLKKPFYLEDFNQKIQAVLEM